MTIALSDHFTLSKLIKFTLPSIIMMIVSSLYSVVDGIFVANSVGKTQFASVNLIMPFLMMFGCLGIMLGTGGSALVAKTLGEGKKEEAHRVFSMLIYILILCGAVLSIVGIIFIEDIAVWLGAEEEMVEYCVTYAMFLLHWLRFLWGLIQNCTILQFTLSDYIYFHSCLQGSIYTHLRSLPP